MTSLEYPRVTHDAAHTASAAAVVGSLLGVLPPLLTALASIGAFLWYGIQVWESKTVQDWLAKRHNV